MSTPDGGGWACPVDGGALRFRGIDFNQQLSWACPAGHLWSGDGAGPAYPAHHSWCRVEHDPGAVTCEQATTQPRKKVSTTLCPT